MPRDDQPHSPARYQPYSTTAAPKTLMQFEEFDDDTSSVSSDSGRSFRITQSNGFDSSDTSDVDNRPDLEKLLSLFGSGWFDNTEWRQLIRWPRILGTSQGEIVLDREIRFTRAYQEEAIPSCCLAERPDYLRLNPVKLGYVPGRFNGLAVTRNASKGFTVQGFFIDVDEVGIETELHFDQQGNFVADTSEAAMDARSGGEYYVPNLDFDDLDDDAKDHASFEDFLEDWQEIVDRLDQEGFTLTMDEARLNTGIHVKMYRPVGMKDEDYFTAQHAKAAKLCCEPYEPDQETLKKWLRLKCYKAVQEDWPYQQQYEKVIDLE